MSFADTISEDFRWLLGMDMIEYYDVFIRRLKQMFDLTKLHDEGRMCAEDRQLVATFAADPKHEYLRQALDLPNGQMMQELALAMLHRVVLKLASERKSGLSHMSWSYAFRSRQVQLNPEPEEQATPPEPLAAPQSPPEPDASEAKAEPAKKVSDTGALPSQPAVAIDARGRRQLRTPAQLTTIFDNTPLSDILFRYFNKGNSTTILLSKVLLQSAVKWLTSPPKPLLVDYEHVSAKNFKNAIGRARGGRGCSMWIRTGVHYLRRDNPGLERPMLITGQPSLTAVINEALRFGAPRIMAVCHDIEQYETEMGLRSAPEQTQTKQRRWRRVALESDEEEM